MFNDLKSVLKAHGAGHADIAIFPVLGPFSMCPGCTMLYAVCGLGVARLHFPCIRKAGCKLQFAESS